MIGIVFPTSQGELIRAARGDETQTAFAKKLGVDRSCLSRYETEALGAPTTVINACLRSFAQQAARGSPVGTDLQHALLHARMMVSVLEAIARLKPRTEAHVN